MSEGRDTTVELRHQTSARKPTAASLLAAAQATIQPILRTQVDSLPEHLSSMARYHFGWTDADGYAGTSPSGKTVRGALVLAAATACSGSATAAAPAAAAVELVHNFSLIHDDVMDHDPIRRGRPTVWRVWGTASAVVLGDALLALAMSTLARSSDVGVLAVARLAEATIALCGGQYEDMAFEKSTVVRTTDYLAMARGKTGALTGCACALGALSAGGDDSMVALMNRIGCELGVAFQLADDVIGLWGDPQVTGKPVGSDLTRRKKTFPVLCALESEKPASQRISEAYSATRPLGTAEVEQLAALVDELGGSKGARRLAEECTAAVIKELSQVDSSTDLQTLARFMARRQR
ncbi:polyprenyl synthetase family protein [Nocardia brasiliensis]|uniref:polyprenyl synthetase family protein n=1 Tax=Nocardia brasiliensis TaxID=37326 RepID=UPI0024553730|nr:polyprenyl synthetase family protein [Nocardia brasiliensis]